MYDQKLNIKYISAGIIAVILTWTVHEFTYWLTGELLGYETIVRLNGTSNVKGGNPTEWHRAIISISAPTIMILQGSIVFLVLKYRGWNKYLYPLLLTVFCIRFLAATMNFVNVDDEGRGAPFQGIGTSILSIIVIVLLFYTVYDISKKYKLNGKFQLGTVLIIMVVSSILILSDHFLGKGTG